MKPFKFLGISLMVLSVIILILSSILIPHKVLDAKIDYQNSTRSYLFNITDNNIGSFIYNNIADKEVYFDNGGWFVLMLLLASLILAEGILIYFNKNITWIADTIGSAKLLCCLMSTLINIILVFPIICIVNGCLIYSLIGELIFCIIIILILSSFIALMVGIYYLQKVLEYIEAIFKTIKQIFKFLFGWYLDLNKWLVKKSAEEDKNGNRYSRNRRR